MGLLHMHHKLIDKLQTANANSQLCDGWKTAANLLNKAAITDAKQQGE
jgi:hypothetical protein